jgi:hypothetical protein
MYARDVPKLALPARQCPHAFLDVVTFVLLTIRQPLHSVASQMIDVRRRGTDSPWLFGSKRDGYAVAAADPTLRPDVLRAIDAGDRVGAIRRVMRLPGLGIVKASFVVQCLGGDAACLDSHNLTRLGLPEGAFKVPPAANDDLKTRKISAYLSICDASGPAEWWWNTWCEYVAGRRGSPLQTADDVSAFHPAAAFAA